LWLPGISGGKGEKHARDRRSKTPNSTTFVVHAITDNSAVKSGDNIAVKFTWEKLGPGSYKLNTSFFENGVGAIAAIIRNCRGEAVTGVAEPFTFADSEATTEALALCRGLQFVNQMGCSRVTIESDCEIISACKGKANILAPYSAILVDCFRYALLQFSSSIIQGGKWLGTFLSKTCF